ncbi:MAG: transposase [Ignavibacteriales bacterium]|nr:transposase [Ignavibacteriales bacterium]
MSPFTINDQHVASTMLEFVNRGDLLIRDLGYFVLNALTSLQQRGAFFITRLRHGTVLSNPHNGKRIKLLRMLRKHPIYDSSVIVGTRERLNVRLIALPVDPVITAQRRRRLKANRDHRLNPSKEHLALLGWNIFLLNVDAQTLSAHDVAALYGLRWRIETIFKAWKSHFHLASFHHVSAMQVKVALYVLFIFVTLFHTFIVGTSDNVMVNKEHRPISLLKLSRCFKEQFWAVALYMFRPAVLYDQISYHCAYEKRKDRINYHQKLLALG